MDTEETKVEKTDATLQHLNEDLYKHNLELAMVNKTLSLLRKLYQISLLELDPVTLANKVSDTVRVDFNLEIAGIFVYDKKKDLLEPLHFSKSERLLASVEKTDFHFKDAMIFNVSKNTFFDKLVKFSNPIMTKDINDVWGGVIPSDKLETVRKESNLKTILLFPLVTQNKTIGVLLLGFNRPYEALSEFEQEAMKSVTDVAAVALDKAYLYRELADANLKLEEVDKRKTEFLSLASHQLRSPITAIKGYTSMVLEGSYGDVTESQREPISRVFQSSLNLANVVEDLLDVAKIEQGGMKYVMQDADLEMITSALNKEFSLTAKSKGLELQYENAGASPCMVSIDPVKFRQVILNLLDNSIKYTEKGFVKLSIKKDGTNAMIVISDSGMGMSPETQAKLFGKFSRGEGTKVNAGGSGIGLYLVKEIVEAHGGTVSAESAGVGKGSVFTVKIPLKTEAKA
ncbi:MAG: HAMP domain-containing histidine kinase [Candidatus Pacebacteria bacterium]|nr:HAMP domain-containing histidine kinase [Candidatus Paceibacterota bacterium]MBP9851763.1 HAMP domain-containing histidine kinase [Candidatus Paceibacterota bacterium]